MDACKMCWKTKEISPVFQAYPKAVEFCKGCAFDIHRVVNALAYALDTSGFAIVLTRRNLTLLDLNKPGTSFINLLTGELVEELVPGDPPAKLPREEVRVFQEVPQGEIEGGSPEGGLREGTDGPSIHKSPESHVNGPEGESRTERHPHPRKSK